MGAFIKETTRVSVLGFAYGVTVIVGMTSGYWLWENVLEDKLDDLQCFVRNKFSKEEEA